MAAAAPEDGTHSSTDISEGSLAIFVIIQHVKSLSSMLGIQKVLHVLRQNIVPVLQPTFISNVLVLGRWQMPLSTVHCEMLLTNDKTYADTLC